MKCNRIINRWESAIRIIAVDEEKNRKKFKEKQNLQDDDGSTYSQSVSSSLINKLLDDCNELLKYGPSRKERD